MEKERMITIGIPTMGEPLIEKIPDGWLLKNMLIGKGFHWERKTEAILPDEIEIRPGEEYGVLNRLPLETYLECVVGSEMNPAAPPEFLKAHAVISRSWALGKILGCHDHSISGKIHTATRIIDWEDTSNHIGFDLCSDDHCQRYQGRQPLPENILLALRETRGEVLTSADGELIDARYSKCCGGRTEVFSTCWQDRNEPCLESFEDPWCDLSGLSPEKRETLLQSILKDYDRETGDGYRWTSDITEESLRENLQNKFGRDIGVITEIAVGETGPSGRAKTLTLKGEKGILEIGKELAVRKLLSPSHLYSSRFTITPVSGGWHLDGRGWGHGVGLCQIGAARMAYEGFSYRSILSFYYPGSHLSLL